MTVWAGSYRPGPHEGCKRVALQNRTRVRAGNQNGDDDWKLFIDRLKATQREAAGEGRGQQPENRRGRASVCVCLCVWAGGGEEGGIRVSGTLRAGGAFIFDPLPR